MTHFINPNYKPHHDLGAGSETDEAAWATLKTKVTDFLDTNAAKSTLLLADARALDDAFDDDRVWGQIMADLGLTEI